MPTFIIGTVDKPNRNNRIYPRDLMEKAIEKYRKQIDEKQSVGELNPEHYSDVVFTNVSHLVTDIRMEGDTVLADIQPLTTPRGIVLQQLLDTQQVEFVTRGIGEISNGKVIEDYQLVSVDAFVKPPSEKIL